MPTVMLTKGQDGRLAGCSQRDDRIYTQWKALVQDMRPDQSVSFSWERPRSGPFHRRHFAILARLFESQEQFADSEMFRKWIEIGAGHCEFAPGPKGKMCAIPKSIAYDKLDEGEFRDVHEACIAFLLTTHATRFLYPHLDDAQGLEMVETVLGEFA